MKVRIFGNNRDRMPDIAFRVMKLLLQIRDRFVRPWSLLDEFGIERNKTVVDYGCGPGSYIRRASELVGPGGRVFAIDVHRLAFKAVTKRINRERLTNVIPVLIDARRSSLPDQTADIIYALDMFHMVSDPKVFLQELNRISKGDGVLFIDDGHQSREEARRKIRTSGMWEIVEEKKPYMKCRPIRKNMERPEEMLRGTA
jgi:ubiquinone/menaquinone biosynthesis C-methylase UbiE